MKRTLLAFGVALVLLAAACGDDSETTTPGTDGTEGTDGADIGAPKPKVTIGAQDFGESAILAEIYKQGLEAKGFEVSIQTLGGFRDLEIKAFESSTINFAPEYAASLLEFLNGKKGEATADVDETVGKLETQLETKGLKALAASEAVDTNAFVITKETSDSLGIKSLSDLASKGKDLKLGAPSDCQTNAFCLPGLKTTYGLDLSGKAVSLETSQIPAALTSGDIDVALLFSTDGQIAANGWVLLEDDKQMLAADNVLPVVTAGLAGNNELVDATDAITETLTTEDLIALNKRYDVDKEDAAVIAKDFLTEKDLL